MTDDQDKPKYATGGPVSPGSTYRIGEYVLPLGWEQHESGSRMAERIKAAWAADPQRAHWLESGSYELHVADGKGGWVQAWPPPKPPKRAWWEYRWPPLVLALVGLICSVIAIAMSLGD